MCPDPAALSCSVYLSHQSARWTSSTGHAAGQYRLPKRTKKTRSARMLRKPRIAPSSNSSASTITIGQKIRGRLTHIISGGSRLKRSMHNPSSYAELRQSYVSESRPAASSDVSSELSREELEAILDNPQLPDDARQQAARILRARGCNLELFFVPDAMLPAFI